MAEFIDIQPLDDQGLRSDRPSTEVKFLQLTNVVNRDGSLVLRPGFIPVGPAPADVENLSVEWGVPVLITEVFNPGASATDRESWSRSSETLRPDANTEIVAGWTGDFTDIDEVVPDGAAYMESATSGSQEEIEFGDLAGSYDAYYGVVIRGRARQSEAGGYADLTIYDSSSGDNILIDTVRIYAYKNTLGESNLDNWQSFALTMPLAPTFSLPWDDFFINVFKATIQNDGGTGSESFEYLSATGDGNYTEWVEYKDELAAINTGAAAAYSDFDGRLIDGIDSDDEFATLSWSDGLTTDSKKQSWTVSGFDDTFTTVSKVTLRCWVANFGSQSGKGLVNLFFRSGGVDYTVHTEQTIDVSSGSPEKGQTVEIEITENPATSSAFTQNELDGSEWGIERVAGRPVIMGTDLVVAGNRAATPTLQVDNLALDAYAVDSGLPHRLLVSTKNYLKLTDGEFGLEDVQGNATATALPALPHDSAILYGQCYMVDGTTTRRYPDGSSQWEDFTDNDGAGTGKISGRTVFAFADRICYGWVTDAGDTTPERVAYSKQFDGSTHNDASAGDFDLLLTPGGVLFGEALNDDIAGVYKQTGVYMLRRTGFSNAPIVPEPVDAQTGIIAPLTCKTLVDRTGQSVQLFLGKNPKDGYNVFRFDGTSVQPIGDPIRAFLRDDSNKRVLENSFAELDPEGGFYWLFVPETTAQMAPQSAYIYDITGETWKKATFQTPVWCAGRWTLTEPEFPLYPIPGGTPKMIIGLGDNLPYKASYEKGHDAAFPPAGNAEGGVTLDYLAQKDGGEIGQVGTPRYMIEAIIESGDIQHPQGLQEDWFPQTLHLNYYDKGPFYLQISVSQNGGKNYQVAETYWLGSYEADGKLKYASLDFPDNTLNPTDSSVQEESVDDVYATRFKLTIGNQDDEFTTKVKIPKARVEWNSTGQNN